MRTETIRRRLQEALNKHYTEEAQMHLEWYEDREDSKRYIWQFIDKGREKRLVFNKETKKVTLIDLR